METTVSALEKIKRAKKRILKIKTINMKKKAVFSILIVTLFALNFSFIKSANQEESNISLSNIVKIAIANEETIPPDPPFLLYDETCHSCTNENGQSGVSFSCDFAWDSCSWWDPECSYGYC